jgi:hypothetical protein
MTMITHNPPAVETIEDVIIPGGNQPLGRIDLEVLQFRRSSDTKPESICFQALFASFDPLFLIKFFNYTSLLNSPLLLFIMVNENINFCRFSLLVVFNGLRWQTVLK